MIGTRTNKGQGMFLGFSRGSSGEEDWVTRPKNVCVGGYHAYRRENDGSCVEVIKHGISAVSVF